MNPLSSQFATAAADALETGINVLREDRAELIAEIGRTEVAKKATR
jgi:hypothetical protein